MNFNLLQRFRPERIKTILKRIVRQSAENDVGLLAAGLAFFALLSLAPLLLIVAYVVGIVLGQAEARSAVLGALGQVFNQETVGLVATMIEGASRNDQGPGAAVFGGVLSIVIGSRVFVHMQRALNNLWGVETQALGKLRNPWPVVRRRLLAFATTVFVAMVFMASILGQIALATLRSLALDWLPSSAPLWNLAHLVAVAVVAAGVFAVLYKVLPDADTQWRWVVGPSVATAVSYVLVSAGISRYLGYEAISSMSGAAGAVMALMIWVFVSAGAFLVGAQACRILADDDGYVAQSDQARGHSRGAG